MIAMKVIFKKFQNNKISIAKIIAVGYIYSIQSAITNTRTIFVRNGLCIVLIQDVV